MTMALGKPSTRRTRTPCMEREREHFHGSMETDGDAQAILPKMAVVNFAGEFFFFVSLCALVQRRRKDGQSITPKTRAYE